jgi:hypothetical protein
LERFGQYLKKVQKWVSHCIFKKWCCSGRGQLWRLPMGSLEFLVHILWENHWVLLKFW